MKLVISPEDVLYHVKQLPLPGAFRVQKVEFAEGSLMKLDAGIDVPIIGELDIKLTLKLSLADSDTLRFDIVDSKLVGISLRDLSKRLLEKSGLVRKVGEEFTYDAPVDFVMLKSVSTDNGYLVVFADGIDLKKLQAYLAKLEAERNK